MSLGYYRLIKGKLSVRHRQSPDGDSMRFLPNDASHLEDLPRYRAPDEVGGLETFQLRFQAIDAPEIHYGGEAQPHGRESRDGLLRWLGVKPKDWDWDVAPEGFEWDQEAAILTDGFDSHGRPIAFVLPPDAVPKARDGSDQQLTLPLLKKTYNHHAVAHGLVYLGFYGGSVTVGIRSGLLAAYDQALQKKKGIWALDRTRQFSVKSLEDLSPGGGCLIYPKIFRRCVDGIRWAGGQFSPGRDLDDFLAAKPGEDDRMMVAASHGGMVKSRLSDVLEQVNSRIRIGVDLNMVEFVAK